MLLRNRIYYRVKPLLPRFVRLALRRQHVRQIRRNCGSVWPIDEAAGRKPEGWMGWPEGKQFAFVLTHDVESQRGLERVKSLAELDMRLGFRSCFNFIPEGGYRVPDELLSWLRERGFEIGVHDLNHDGRLYESRRRFVENAASINRCLGKWGATGFRSAFMLRNLDWLHDLDIAYDSSTFDTDPFEPQPDGAATIFPFWVPNPQFSSRIPHSDSRVPHSDDSPFRVPRSQGPSSILQPPSSGRTGYVELPYTLPQDSTLFLLLGEKTPEIWIRKVDWIAQHGGMVLVNVHPDYVRFESEPGMSNTFSESHYTALLNHIRERYAAVCWQPLAGQVAAFVRRDKPLAPRQRRRIAMVTYSHFQGDARVKRYAEALAGRGDEVDVIALRRSPEEPVRQQIEGVNLVSLQLRRGKQEKSPFSFLWPVMRFLFSSSWWITRDHFRKPYDLLHIHNIPDFLVFAGWYPKLTGTKIILDIHDIVPEFYGSKFKVPDHSPIIGLLKWIERLAARFASHIIVSNDLWREKYAARTATRGRCSVFINNVDTSIFHPRERTRNDGKTVMLFPGGLQWHQGLDIAIRAFSCIAAEIPNAEFHIYGDGNMKESLVALAHELGLADRVLFFDPLPVGEIAEVMANADLGVVPKRADCFGNEAYSTKIMEFMSVGVPVVVSSTKIDRFYFNDSVVRFFESGNHQALAEAIMEILRDKELRRRMPANASEYVAINGWESRKQEYLRIVDALAGDLPVPAETIPVTSPSQEAHPLEV